MEGGGIRVRAESGRPRLTLLDQMSAITADGRELAGLTLDDILGSQKRAAPAPAPDAVPAPAPEPPGRTLLDIIRDEDPMAGSCKSFDAANRDRRSWRSFKDRLRLKRSGSGAAWTSSVHVPTSDILIPTSRSMVSRRNSVGSLFAESPHDAAHPDDASAAAAPQGFRPQISRRSSCRFGTSTSFASDPTRSFDDNSAGNDGVVTDANSSGSSPIRRPSLSHAPSLRHQISRRHSTRFSPAMDDGGVSDPTEPLPPQREGSRRLSAVLAEERSLSAREAVAAQEAAEAASAAAAAAAADESETDSPAAATEAAPAVRMSLMDLLEETDRQMGLVGSRYMFDDDEDYEEEEEEELGSGAVAVAGAEQNCCVCMVRHKGAAFIPCGHTFCRLCSRELWVSRGNCPLCNGFILEILDIF